MIKIKDPVSAWLHIFGAVLSIAALVSLLIIGRDSLLKEISFAIFGGSMILLYSFSSIYHLIPTKLPILRKLDHVSIYLLIAGTYTPFCLVTLNGIWGWSLLSIIWTMALIGITISSIYISPNRWLATGVYIIMGWAAIAAIRPLIDNLSVPGLLWLLAGGIIYSFGGIIYAFKKPNFSTYFGSHEIWHIFVLLGSICHYISILLYVAW